MYLSRDPDDRRPELRDRVRRSFAELVDDLEHDVPPRVVLSALVGVAKRLHLRLEGDDPIRPAHRRGLAP